MVTKNLQIVAESHHDVCSGTVMTAGADTELVLIRDLSAALEKKVINAPLVLLVCTTVLLLIAVLRHTRVKSSLDACTQGIPMAFSLPFIGNVSLLRGLPHLVVTSLSERYGKIFKLNAGGDRTFVVLNDVDMVRDAMRQFPSAMTGKPQTTTTKMTNDGAQQDMGKRWNRRRHISMVAIKGLFRESPDMLEDVCESELQRLIATLKSRSNEGHEPTQDVTTFVARTMWRLIYGRGQLPDEMTAKQCEELASKMDDYTQNSGPFSLLDRFPFAKKLFSKALPKYQNAVQFMQAFCDVNENKRHAECGRPAQAHSDIMDLLTRGARGLTSDDRENLGLSENLMTKGLGDLVRSGTESPSLLIIWVCLMLAKYPEVQNQMLAEIQCKKDRESDVVFNVSADRMPYTQAVVYETMRYCSIIPFLKRRTLDNVTVAGHSLPVGTNIIINNHAISHDTSRWGDPHVFRPARFLHRDGSLNSGQLEKILPFGVGKRRCMGEELGKLIPSAAIATLVSNFNIVAPKCKQLSTVPSFGITLTPQPQPLIFESRVSANEINSHSVES